MSARSFSKGRWADQALGLLYDLKERVAGASSRQDGTDAILDLLLSRLSTSRGAVGIAHPAGDVEVLSARGVTAEVFLRRCERAGPSFTGLLSSAKGAVALLRSGGAVRAGEQLFLPVSGGTPDREEVSFLCAPVPAGRAAVPFLALDRLFPDEIEREEDARLLLTAASLLSPLFIETSRGEGAPSRRRAPGSSLGSTLQRHIAAWIEPMENTRRLRSDVYERLVGEVEKILIAAALEKTGYVQTEAARFLGINRNTLAKKIRRYGLGKKGG